MAMQEEPEVLYEGVVNAWIAACYQLIKGLSLVGLSLVSKKLVYVEDAEEAKNERRIMIEADFLDSGMEIGEIVLTRINQEKTLVQITRDPLPDTKLIMFTLRRQNREIKQRFDKIKETAPATLASVTEAVKEKLQALGLL